MQIAFNSFLAKVSTKGTKVLIFIRHAPTIGCINMKLHFSSVIFSAHPTKM